MDGGEDVHVIRHKGVTVCYPPGYGLHLFGTVIPFPPAPVLWALAVLDIVATVWLWRRPGRWPILLACIFLSAYLTVVGIFSIGPIYFLLLCLQLAMLVRTAVWGRRPD